MLARIRPITLPEAVPSDRISNNCCKQWKIIFHYKQHMLLILLVLLIITDLSINNNHKKGFLWILIKDLLIILDYQSAT